MKIDPLVMASEIIARQQEKGLKKYGVPVAGAEGQDWLRHAAEEAADLLVYLCAEIVRRDHTDTAALLREENDHG